MAHYAVANNTAVNVAVCVSDQGEWPDSSVMGMTGTRDSVLDAMRGWHPTVLGLLRLLPNELLKWGLFDYYEFPAARYNAGRVCIAGDAAHASTPHHGSGACFGVSDCCTSSHL
jgi:salicylate hydroxylase